MSVISDLIDKVNDPDLRARLNEEVARMQKQKKFGLVFEEHLPEATPLYEAAIRCQFPVPVASSSHQAEPQSQVFVARGQFGCE